MRALVEAASVPEAMVAQRSDQGASVVPEVPTMALEVVVAALYAVPESGFASMTTHCGLAP